MPGHTRIRGGSCHIVHKEEGRTQTDHKDDKNSNYFVFVYTDTKSGTKARIEGKIPRGTNVKLRWLRK